MKKILLIMISFILVASCSNKKPKSIFSQVDDYCAQEGNCDNAYCKLGIHQRTLEEIRAIYGLPMDSSVNFTLPMDYEKWETGDWEFREVPSLCSKFKGEQTPPMSWYRWNLGPDSCSNDSLWLQVYFMEDEPKQYRAVYGLFARSMDFYIWE